ncbi:MAG: hypothetical protein J6W52_10525 [Bacteroidaceae bacterium]|nr:hypothetical protein [Bacteroidaceae bacterium]
MSYRRSFSRTISVPYSGSKSVSYPASQNGGTMTVSYSGTAHENVNVDIYVDTDPFDASVENCNRHVNGLTASVGAMNAAQCAAIAENAEKVSKSLIDGFFHTVRTDLATQKAELEQTVEARLILLRQQAASLREKQAKMSEDYARTTARYQKIFSDLNNELSIRIHEIDQPVFNMAKDIDEQSDRMLHTDMVQTAVTMSKETSILQAQINAATVKRHALEAMTQAKNFLVSKASSERTIQESLIDGTGKDGYLVPVCYMRTDSGKEGTKQKCYVPDYYKAKDRQLEDRLCQSLKDVNFAGNSNAEEEQLKSYVQSEMAKKITGDDSHSDRVRTMINKMLNK